MSKWLREKKQVLEAAQKMAAEGLVVGRSGNVSIRLLPEDGRELLAVTPTSRYYDTLSVDDIPVIDFNMETVEGDLRPSKESLLHIGIYRARENINAVIHTHSVYASAVSVAGMAIPPILEDQVAIIGGEIKLAEDAFTGSETMVENVLTALEERNAVLLPNHGAVGIGRTLREAYTVCELLERTSHVFYLASSLGKVNPLPEDILPDFKIFFRG